MRRERSDWVDLISFLVRRYSQSISDVRVYTSTVSARCPQVDQRTRKEWEKTVINNKLAFLDVIKVIERSSKAELQAIARVEKAIVKSGAQRVVAETEKPRQSRRIDPRLGRAPRVEEPTTSSVSSDYAPAGSGSPMHQDTTSDQGEVVDENQATQENNIVVVVPEAKPNDAQKVESEVASSSSVIDAPSVNVDTTVDNGAIY